MQKHSYITIDSSLQKELKRLAITEGRFISDIANEAIRNHLKKLKKKQKVAV